MFTLFNRRRRRRTHNNTNFLVPNVRVQTGAKRAASLPPARIQRQISASSQVTPNLFNGGVESNSSGDFSRHSQPRTINLLYGELPWHVSHSDVYGVSTGIQQDFPEVQKMPLFGSVPALHQMNSIHGDMNNNNINAISNGKPEDISMNNQQDGPRLNENNNTNENYIGSLRYFNLRQPVNIAGHVDPKVLLHDNKKEEQRPLNQNNNEPTMIIQPLSLMPDWR